MHQSEQPSSPLDKENMLGYINALPEQLESAWLLGMSLPLAQVPQIEHVLIAGMGGSAIGGDMLAAYARERCQVPFITHRDYGLPAWANGPSTLVICSSHSGNTEETLSAFQTALQRNCSLLTLSTGGKLATQAEDAGVVSWQFVHPGQPRTAVAYSFGMLLACLQRLHLIPDSSDDLRSAIVAMRKQRQILDPGLQDDNDPAKQLACLLFDRNVAIFAADVFEVIARRWKTQLNELAKAWAQFEGLPEGDHNTLVATLNPQALLKQLSAVFLTSDFNHPRNQLRLKLTRQMLGQSAINTHEVWGQGETLLAQLWTLLQFGDYVAYHLALQYAVDPTPVEALSQLKDKLSEL